MSRRLYRALRLLAALACGCAASATTADETVPEPRRQEAEAHLLRGEITVLLHNPAFQGEREMARGLSLPGPLVTWRIDMARHLLGGEAVPRGLLALRPSRREWTTDCSELRPNATEGWPVVAALRLERCLRETLGAQRLPDGSPLAALPDPEGTIARFLDLQGRVFHPVTPEQSSDAAWAAEARAVRKQADSLRSTSNLWAALAAGLLLLFTLALGFGLRQRLAARP